jgi:hypothetical protein
MRCGRCGQRMLAVVENTLWGRRYHGRCAFCGPVAQETGGGIVLLSRHEVKVPAVIRERMDFVASIDRGVHVRTVENPLEEVAHRAMIHGGDDAMDPGKLIVARLLRAWSQAGINN